MRAARTDANQKAIVFALRAAGCSVQPLHRVGDGCPDLLVGYHGINYLIECKLPKKGRNALQKSWQEHWRGEAHVAHSAIDAINIVAHERIGRYPVIEAS